MQVYLASRPTNRELNDILAAEFEERGHHCHIPRHVPRRAARRECDARDRARTHAAAHAAAIAEADVVLLIGPDLDSEVAWKAGYARALGKRVVLVCPAFEPATDNLFLADDVVRIGTLDDIADVVEDVIATHAAQAAAPARLQPTGRPDRVALDYPVPEPRAAAS